MGPNNVGQVLCEVRILRRSEPLRENSAPRLAFGNLRFIAAEEFRLHGFAGDQMFHVAIAAIVNNGLARIFALLSSDLREKCGEAVIVVHRPAVEGMVMALRALDAHAHEHLRGVFGGLLHVGLHLIIAGRGILQIAAGGGEQFLHDFVDRHVVQHFFLQPIVIFQRRFIAELIVARTDLQQLRKFHDPELREFLAPKQIVNQLAALGRAWIVDELLDFFGFRECSG